MKYDIDGEVLIQDGWERTSDGDIEPKGGYVYDIDGNRFLPPGCPPRGTGSVSESDESNDGDWGWCEFKND